MDVLISVVVAVLLAEGYVWVPRLSDWLVEHAVSQLVRDEQDRFREEWKAHLHDYPNSIVQLVHALSFAWPGATRRINAAILDARLSETDSAFDEVKTIRLQVAQEVRALSLRVAERRDVVMNLKQHLEKSRGSFPSAIATNKQQIDLRAALLEAIRSYEIFGNTVVSAINRATGITAGRVDKWNEWIAHMTQKLEWLDARSSHLREQVGNRQNSRTTLARSLQELNCELKDVRDALENPNIDDCDEATLEEWKRIMKALDHTLNAKNLIDLQNKFKSLPARLAK